MQYYYYKCIAKLIAVSHLLLILGNLACIVFLVGHQPIYIWLPLLSLMASPIMGGTHCYLNTLENIYREKAGLPKIVHRLQAFLSGE